MNKTFCIAALTLLAASCSGDDQPEQRTVPVAEEKSEPVVVEKEVDPNKAGRAELTAFAKKYERNWDVPPAEFPYSDGDKYKVYELDCSGECLYAEFRKRKSTGIEVPKDEFLALVTLLKDPKSYDNGTAACFDPKFGLVVYDSHGVPTEFLSICLDCNSCRTYPGEFDINYEHEFVHGFSNSTRDRLREMFFGWEIDYYGFSEFYDDEQAYVDYLDNKRDTTAD
jgi:hypothetical protein